jgi:hypothetical protein
MKGRRLFLVGELFQDVFGEVVVEFAMPWDG